MANGGEAKPRISILGLGIMGEPMAANIARAGLPLTVWNRTASKADAFAQSHDASAAATPAAAAAGADVLITMVVDAPDVEQVLFGEHGAVETLDTSAVVVDMSTIAPTASRRIGARLADQGIAFLDAPVTGSRPRAEDGTLTIMVGGEHGALEQARPALDALGEVIHVGPQGHGSMVKLINNTLAAVNTLAVAEGLVLAQSAGLDTAALRRVVGSGSGASAVLELKSDAMLHGDFAPLFKLEHLLKDVRHCLAEASALGIELPLASLAEQRYAEAAERGDGQSDFAAVFRVVKNPSAPHGAEKNT